MAMTVGRTAVISFPECERKLEEWGRWSRKLADGLGYPRSSGIARMIEMVKVFPKGKAGDARAVTARGKQTLSFRPLSVGEVPREIVRIDAIIAGMSGEDQGALSRSYRFGQPDRIAARELRISREEYTGRRERAVLYVARKLES